MRSRWPSTRSPQAAASATDQSVSHRSLTRRVQGSATFVTSAPAARSRAMAWSMAAATSGATA